MAANLGNALLAVVAGILMAHALGPVGRGDLAVVIFWPQLVANLLDVTVIDSVAIRVARDASAAGSSTKTALSIALLSSVLGTCALAVLLPVLLSHEQAHLIGLCHQALLIIPVSMLACVPLGLLQGLGRFHRFALLRISSFVVYAVGIVTLMVTGYGSLQSFVLVTIVSRAVPAVLAAPIFLLATRSSSQAGALAGHIRDVVSLQGPRTVFVFISSEDRLLANETLSQEAIGQWQVAAAAIQLMPFVGQALSQRVLAHSSADPARDRTFLESAYVRSVAVTLAFASIGSLLLPVLVPLLYGRGFAAAVVPTILVALASVFAAGAITLQGALRARMRNSACFVANLGSALVMAAVGVMLLHTGLIGLALACLAGRITLLLLTVRASLAAGLLQLASLVPWGAGFVARIKADFGALRAVLQRIPTPGASGK